MPIRSKYELAEPGVDPIANPIPRESKPNIPWFLLITGVLFAMVMMLKFCTPKTTAEAAHPTIDATKVKIMVEQTLTAAPSYTPTLTATIYNTATFQSTQPPLFYTSNSDNKTNITTQPPIIPAREVTRVVYINQPVLQVVTRIIKIQQTRIIQVEITNTPGPSQTPWVITVVVAPTITNSPTPSQTPKIEEITPTDTPTPSQTPTIEDIISIVTETPTETPTETATAGSG